MSQPRSVILINDPGVDGAFTTCLALLDPRVEVAAVLATPGHLGPGGPSAATQARNRSRGLL
jgi:inosine-uridine nucleoside N-ribohydrolase